MRFFGAEVDWKWVKKVLPSAGWIVEATEIRQWQANIQDVPGAPQLEWMDPIEERKINKPEVWPILQLRDARGAFADLWMDDGQGCRFPMHEDARQQSVERDLHAERAWEKDLLETHYVKKQVDHSHYYCPLDKIAKSLTFLLEVGWTILDYRGNRVYRQGDVRMAMQSQHQQIVARGKIAYDAFTADISDVVGAFNRREQFVALGEGAVGLLETTSEIAVLTEGEVISEGVRLKRSQFGALSEVWQSPHVTLDDTLQQLRRQFESKDAVSACVVEREVGAGFSGSLRSYQQQGLNWMQFLRHFGLHGLLADDMGLGKTVQVLAFLSGLEKKGPHLVVMPKSLLFNWQQEISRFLPHASIYVHQGAERQKNPAALMSCDVVLCSYAVLRLDSDLFSQVAFDVVVLDEAQWIKNAESQTAQAAYRLQAQFRLSLTGTPIENSWNDLWAHFRFLMPDLLGSQEEFAAHVQAAQFDGRHLLQIKRKIRPFILRRTKEQVAKELPDKIEQVVWVTMEEEQRQQYETFLAGLKGGLLQKVSQEGLHKHRMEVLEGILRLRQLCCHPLLIDALLPPETSRTSAKLEALVSDLQTVVAEERKALVYSQFSSMLTLIGRKLQELGLPFLVLDGSTVNRQAIVQRFQEDSAMPIFLISLKAGGVGLNLTAADYVFLYDPWWNEAVEKQAIDRAHRIGQQKTVVAKRFVCHDSIEEKMMTLKAHKRGISSEIIENEESIKNLSLDDLLFLLN
jgi:SNF2 family DNA or RNA helicase